MTDDHNYLTEIINIWSSVEVGDFCNLDYTAGNQTSRIPKVVIYLVANPSLGKMKRQRVSATTPSCTVRGSPLMLCVLLVILVLMFTQSMARNVRPSYEATRRVAPKLTRTLAFSRNHLKSVDKKVLRTKLLHRDHPESPLSPANATASLRERFAAAVKRSNERRDAIERKLCGTLASNSEFESPIVSSSTSGEYLMTLNLGTPAQTFNSVVDTGSDLVWVQCTPCISCYTQTGALFDSSKSSSYSVSSCTDSLCSEYSLASTCDPNCHYQYQYGDNSSTSGELSRDTITLTDSTNTSTEIANFAFGCGTDNQGSFQPADGIVGLGQGALSFNTQISTLSSYSDTFSYCLVAFTATTSTSSYLDFGANPTNSTTTSSATDLVLAYTSILTNINFPTYYYVPMTGISVNGVDLGLLTAAFELDINGNGGVILDSGTTLTYLITYAYDQVVQYLKNLITYPQVDGTPYGLDLCYNVVGVASPAFPTMAFQFSGTDSTTSVYLSLSQSNLFVQIDSQTPDIYCLPMASTQQFSIIGNIQQSDHHIEYDVANQRIGWATTTC